MPWVGHIAGAAGMIHQQRHFMLRVAAQMCIRDRMMTVNEVSKRTGVSIRTLQYYDKIGLLRAAGRTEAGYRL